MESLGERKRSRAQATMIPNKVYMTHAVGWCCDASGLEAYPQCCFSLCAPRLPGRNQTAMPGRLRRLNRHHFNRVTGSDSARVPAGHLFPRRMGPMLQYSPLAGMRHGGFQQHLPVLTRVVRQRNGPHARECKGGNRMRYPLLSSQQALRHSLHDQRAAHVQLPQNIAPVPTRRGSLGRYGRTLSLPPGDPFLRTRMKHTNIFEAVHAHSLTCAASTKIYNINHFFSF